MTNSTETLARFIATMTQQYTLEGKLLQHEKKLHYQDSGPSSPDPITFPAWVTELDQTVEAEYLTPEEIAKIIAERMPQ